jgi:predicted RNA-binding protein with PUA-like domain
MARYVYCPEHPEANHNGMITADLHFLWKVQHVHGSAAHYISDHMDATQHMANGQYYDSKSEFRKVTRAYGCIEVGNEIPTLTKPRPDVKIDRRERRDHIRRAIQELKSGR